MAVIEHDVGLVSERADLADFYAAVFELDELEPLVFPMGTVRRLRLPGGHIKVMTPNPAPDSAPTGDTFWSHAGYRYSTLTVDDVKAVVAACLRLGGSVVMEPTVQRPGVTLAVIADPDGNAVELKAVAPSAGAS